MNNQFVVNAADQNLVYPLIIFPFHLWIAENQ